MRPSNNLARESVSLLPHLHNLSPHLFVLHWVPMPLLGLQEDWERTSDEVEMAILNEALIPLILVPKEWRQALEPLKPR
jgi:hypothetical protein